MTLDQRINGGKWIYLGTFTMAPGGSHSIQLSGASPWVSIADAVAIAPDTAAPNTATWQPTITTADDYDVYAKWKQSTVHASNAPYTIFHANGSTTVLKNQRKNGGTWVLLGRYHLEPNEDHRIELVDTPADGAVAISVSLFNRTGSLCVVSPLSRRE